ncbi:MAG: heparinase II/III family protein [Gemmatimonadaceae bacterium]|nr:heparinase II/III family protein [Gemmatimonadaceae bacterium]
MDNCRTTGISAPRARCLGASRFILVLRGRRTPAEFLHVLLASQTTTLVTRADEVVTGAFRVLGLDSLPYGKPVDWQRDPMTGRPRNCVHWSRVPYLDHERVGDHKVIWELNRHQRFITLGQAWLLTGNDQYADDSRRHCFAIGSTRIPPKRGINWCSSLELAFRVQSWIHGLRLFDGADALTVDLRRDMVASAMLQVDHIERNLSTWFSPNTHLTGEALAMLAAGCAWPQLLPRATRWREKGWQILCNELTRQVRPDGVYFEQSAWYRRPTRSTST